VGAGLTRRVWILNLDAETELADPSAHTPSRAVAERSRALHDRLEGLLPPGDEVLSPGAREPVDARPGRAWCPTPRALAALARAGAIPPAAPPLAVLRRVNHRRFCAELGQTLEGARLVGSRVELGETLASRPGPWLLQRPLGFAGRGRLRLAGPPSEAEERWIAASFAAGDVLQVEPYVERLGDHGLHGHLSAAGTLVLGEPTVQRCAPTGAWEGSERAPVGSLDARETDALVAAAEEAAGALREAGYFGPFGIDAFRYRWARGEVRFNPRCEINARYSMGWAVGMGNRRPDLEEP
jgi:hypothetical protein